MGKCLDPAFEAVSEPEAVIKIQAEPKQLKDVEPERKHELDPTSAKADVPAAKKPEEPKPEELKPEEPSTLVPQSSAPEEKASASHEPMSFLSPKEQAAAVRRARRGIDGEGDESEAVDEDEEVEEDGEAADQPKRKKAPKSKARAKPKAKAKAKPKAKGKPKSKAKAGKVKNTPAKGKAKTKGKAAATAKKGSCVNLDSEEEAAPSTRKSKKSKPEPADAEQGKRKSWADQLAEATTEEEKKAIEKKAKASRKSSAYHVAMAAAMKGGSSKEEALKAAKAVPFLRDESLHVYMYVVLESGGKLTYIQSCMHPRHMRLLIDPGSGPDCNSRMWVQMYISCTYGAAVSHVPDFAFGCQGCKALTKLRPIISILSSCQGVK